MAAGFLKFSVLFHSYTPRCFVKTRSNKFLFIGAVRLAFAASNVCTVCIYAWDACFPRFFVEIERQLMSARYSNRVSLLLILFIAHDCSLAFSRIYSRRVGVQVYCLTYPPLHFFPRETAGLAHIKYQTPSGNLLRSIRLHVSSRELYLDIYEDVSLLERRKVTISIYASLYIADASGWKRFKRVVCILPRVHTRDSPAHEGREIAWCAQLCLYTAHDARVWFNEC